MRQMEWRRLRSPAVSLAGAARRDCAAAWGAPHRLIAQIYQSRALSAHAVQYLQPSRMRERPVSLSCP